MTASALFDPGDFRIPAGVTHVCAGGETPFLHRHDAALRQYAEDKSNGMAGRTAQEEQVLRARQGIAARWCVDGSEIGFVSSVAEGVSMVVESIDWRPGDNICVHTDEYPSVVAPFAMQLRQHVAVRLASGDAVDGLAALVDRRTRVIAVSYVSYLNGERFDLQALRSLADSVGAMLLVDYTQAAGYLPIDGSVADFAFSACYKWLLGMTGVAVAYWNRTRQPDWQPTTAGWHSIASGARPDYAAGLALQPDATRFTRGNPAHGPIYVLASALEYLAAFDVQTVQRHIQALTAMLHCRLREEQITPSTPEDTARHGASVCVDSGQAQAVVEALNRRNVYAWNGRGRVRFSFHGYNSASDIDRIMAAMREEWRA